MADWEPERTRDVVGQLLAIGEKLEQATAALRKLVEELRADLPSDSMTPMDGSNGR